MLAPIPVGHLPGVHLRSFPGLSTDKIINKCTGEVSFMPLVRCSKALRGRVAPTFSVWESRFGEFPCTFLPCPGLAEHGDSEGSNAPPCCLLWLCSSDIFRHSCEFSVSREGPFFGKFGEMPDSKPNPRKVELLKEWLEDLLKPGYVNQRIESLKRRSTRTKPRRCGS